MTNHYLGVAFRRGEPRYWHDLLVMESTRGPYVHSELFLQCGEKSRFYTSYDASRQPSAITPTSRRLPLPQNWEALRFPISTRGYKAAYALILQLMTIPIPYNNQDLWQCAIPLVLPFERDLDCMAPASWTRKGVFCSQFCLLLLRRLAAQGHLHIEPSVRRRVFSTNSRGCSPNALHELLLPPPEKKGTNHGVSPRGEDDGKTAKKCPRSQWP